MRSMGDGMHYAHAVVVVTALLVTAGVSVTSAADLVTIADAEEAMVVPGGGTFNIWIGGGYFNAPVANGLGTVGDNINFEFVAQSDNGAALRDLGLNGGLNVWTPVGEAALYAGIDFDLLRVTHDEHVDLNGLVIVDPLPIDGGTSTLALFVDSDGVDSTAEIGFGRVTAAAGLGVGSGEIGSVAIGLLASGAELELNSTISNPNDVSKFVSLEESVGMLSGGVVVAGQMDARMGDGVGLTLGGRVALLYATGELDASQTISNIIAPIDATDTDEGLAGLLEAKAALNFDVGEGAVFSITGGVGARNDYFSIVNPRSGPGIRPNNPASYDPGPAFIEQAVMWKATLGVGLGGSF